MKLNSLYQDVNNPQGWIVAVLAPTGLAAYNINGLTIHRFFKLPIFGNSDPQMIRMGIMNGNQHWDLSADNLKLIRSLLPNLKLIIIGKLIVNIHDQ